MTHKWRIMALNWRVIVAFNAIFYFIIQEEDGGDP